MRTSFEAAAEGPPRGEAGLYSPCSAALVCAPASDTASLPHADAACRFPASPPQPVAAPRAPRAPSSSSGRRPVRVRAMIASTTPQKVEAGRKSLKQTALITAVGLLRSWVYYLSLLAAVKQLPIIIDY